MEAVKPTKTDSLQVLLQEQNAYIATVSALLTTDILNNTFPDDLELLKNYGKVVGPQTLLQIFRFIAEEYIRVSESDLEETAEGAALKEAYEILKKNWRPDRAKRNRHTRVFPAE